MRVAANMGTRVCIFIISLPNCLQKDRGISRLLFSAIFRAIMVEIERVKTEREAQETVAQIKRCLNSMLENSTQYCPQFISCVLVSPGCRFKKNHQSKTRLLSVLKVPALDFLPVFLPDPYAQTQNY